jgi:hypothetical protein
VLTSFCAFLFLVGIIASMAFGNQPRFLIFRIVALDDRKSADNELNAGLAQVVLTTPRENPSSPSIMAQVWPDLP